MSYGHAERTLDTIRSLEAQTRSLLEHLRGSNPALWGCLVETLPEAEEFLLPDSRAVA